MIRMLYAVSSFSNYLNKLETRENSVMIKITTATVLQPIPEKHTITSPSSGCCLVIHIYIYLVIL